VLPSSCSSIFGASRSTAFSNATCTCTYIVPRGRGMRNEE
jgi:hypothetical protein